MPKRTRKIPTYPGRMKERRKKEEERKQNGNCTPGVELKVRKGSHIWGGPLTGGEISRDRSRASEAQR